MQGDDFATRPTGHYVRVPAGRPQPREIPAYDPRTGQHCWVAAAIYVLKNPDDDQQYLDGENLAKVLVGCRYCQKRYAPGLNQRRCTGAP